MRCVCPLGSIICQNNIKLTKRERERERDTKKVKKNNNNNNTVEEDILFLTKRVGELVDRLEVMEDDIERVTFVLALFGKYMQYYSMKNQFMVDKDVIQLAILSTNIELQKAFGEHPISDYEQELIIAYLEKIQSKMYEFSDEERKKLR